MANLKETRIMFLLVLFSLFQEMICQPEVETRYGSVRGVTTEVYGVNVSSFLGIPYAKPPVGHLRFRAPLPTDTWTGTLNATNFGKMCPQTTYPWMVQQALGEDCLTLNIFKPENIADASLSVMVFIHGGGFTIGSSLQFDGSILAALQKVIVVTMNYRLGALGFLCTNDRHATGNYGLLDQQMAIRWVKDNIGTFGGDTNKITLFGESAGGMSVGFHMLSPTNYGLFQRAISQSGVPTTLMMADKPVYWARRLGLALNCTNVQNHGKLISCIRSKTWQEIIYNNPPRERLDVWERQFLPVVDGRFIPMKPEALLYSNSNFSTYDFLLGFNSLEGKFIYYLPELQEISSNVTVLSGLTADRFKELIADDTTPYYTDEMKLIQSAVLNHYTDWFNPSSDIHRLISYSSFLGDQMFVAPTIEFAQRHAHGDSSTYLYQFSYESAQSQSYYPTWLKGAAHADELPYVFGMPFSAPQMYTEEERDVSSMVMKYWSNFAKTGNPNTGETENVSWPMYTVGDQQYLDLNNPVTIGERIKFNDIAFWLNYIPTLQAVNCPVGPTDVIQVIGEGLGLSLTDGQLTQLMEGFIAAVILLAIIIVTLTAVICVYARKDKSVKNLQS
ncbi:acetylcholinesterase-like [Ptychodera flava]|uniref:acetylcholinesterase-like n=1 Tax=Ptychodera flava TaxID=63121 RepID=UPI003969E623